MRARRQLLRRREGSVGTARACGCSCSAALCGFMTCRLHLRVLQRRVLVSLHQRDQPQQQVRSQLRHQRLDFTRALGDFSSFALPGHEENFVLRQEQHMEQLLDRVVVNFAEVVQVRDTEQTRIERVEAVDFGRLPADIEKDPAGAVCCDNPRVELSLFVEFSEVGVVGVFEAPNLVEVAVQFRQQLSVVRPGYSESNWLAWSNLPSLR